MKLRRLPDDFRVEELTDFAHEGGTFAVYRLTKRSLGTPEAVDVISRQWRIPRPRIAYGGLKDRHAMTVQHLTIEGGPNRGIRRPNLELVYLGQAARAFTPADIAGNRFALVLRDMTRREIERAEASLPEAARDGLPNYFDDQRFGSVGPSGEFIARPWCEGNYERALWLALAEPNAHDRPPDRREKQLLRDHWGEWPRLLPELDHASVRRPPVALLTRQPGQFREAFARIRTDLRGLYLSAFQSYLWNRLLAAFLREHCRDDQLVPITLDMGPVPFVQRLDDDQRQSLQGTTLPLPSARLHLDAGPTQDLMDRMLGELGLELRMLRVKYPRDSFFSRGDRAVLSPVRDLQWRTESDELYPDRRKLSLDFTLTRGAYATILVKRITQL